MEKDYALLECIEILPCVFGVLNGKVYTVQLKENTFAAIHGDAEVHDQSSIDSSLLQSHVCWFSRNYASIFDYFKTAGLSINTFL